MEKELQKLLALMGPGGDFHTVKARGGKRWKGTVSVPRYIQEWRSRGRVAVSVNTVKVAKTKATSMEGWVREAREQDELVPNSETIIY